MMVMFRMRDRNEASYIAGEDDKDLAIAVPVDHALPLQPTPDSVSSVIPPLCKPLGLAIVCSMTLIQLAMNDADGAVIPKREAHPKNTGCFHD